MYGDSGELRYWPVDVEDPLIILVASLHGGTSGTLLRHPVQGTPGCSPWGSPLPHHIQHGSLHSNFSLGCSGSIIGVGTERFQAVDTMAEGVLLQ